VKGLKRVALVGTGIRGVGMWGVELLRDCGEWVELVAMCDANRLRVEAGRRVIGADVPVYTDFETLLEEARPETVVVATRDAVHHEQIVAALARGCDVVTEKPLTVDEAACRAILEAEAAAGGASVTVAFNYRYRPTLRRVKELLVEGAIGEVVSVDFHWYLDVYHGADYFRRWHAYRRNSGTLFVHKAAHHFDLLNWLLEDDPVEVSAFGDLRTYGRNGRFRGPSCRTCDHAAACAFRWDIGSREHHAELYAACEAEDNYVRDACVFRDDIDIFDTMAAVVSYSRGAMASYSLNAAMPYEGFHLALNGLDGRIEVRCHERQPWPTPREDEVRVTRSFGETEVVRVPWGEGGHFGGDRRLLAALFGPGAEDPLGQRADSRAGAMSLVTGLAAVRSVDEGRRVRVAEFDVLPAAVALTSA
jgi:predicted dehydrogenase